MHVLWKSILTGFGMKIGGEIARMMSDRMQAKLDAKDETKESDEDKQAQEDLEEAIAPHLPVVPLPSGDSQCDG